MLLLLLFLNEIHSLPINIYIYTRINNQNLEKIQLGFNWILNFAPRIPSNF